MAENPPTPGAVFLSYASQDAEAAKRICEALRQAGVEVWFDQSELVGGDAWDGKIRGQIGSCALFVPIISANTQARLEGYFRREWKQAAARTQDMADEKAFLLPVVIDGTRDAEAKVPAEFKAVQWTRLPGGETPVAFCERVKKLLGGETSEDRSQRTERRTENREPKTEDPAKPRWLAPVLGVLAVAVLALALTRPWEKPGIPAASAAPAVAPVSESRRLLGQVQALLADPNYTRETYQLADELIQRATALDATDGEIWATAAIVSQELHIANHDRSTRRVELVRLQAARAIQLAPQRLDAQFAAARNYGLSGAGTQDESRRLLKELLVRAPEDRRIIRSLTALARRAGDDADVNELLARARRLPGGDPLTLLAEVRDLRGRGRIAESEALLNEVLASQPIRLAYYEKLLLAIRTWHELDAVPAVIASIPLAFRQQEAFAGAIAEYHVWAGESDKAIEVLAQLPVDFLEEFNSAHPKALLAGRAYSAVGKTAAARQQWEKALALVETRIAADASDLRLLLHKATLQGLLGDAVGGAATWQLRLELGGAAARPPLGQEARALAALGDTEVAASTLAERWPKEALGQRLGLFNDLRFSPGFAALRRDPRIQQLLAAQLAENDRLKAATKPSENQKTEDGGQRTEDRAQKVGPTLSLSPSHSPPPDAKSVAVLAFANLSDDKANEYFSDGISEELLNVLAKVPGLKVTARTSAFHFKGKDTPIPEIAKQLGVAYVIEGSVRKAGEKVRITAQLIKAADGFHVWSDTFTRDLKDIFAVQDEIAAIIARNLELKMGVVSSNPDEVNPEAYQHLLRARFFSRREDNDGRLKAVEECKAALAIDPNFALAAAEMARSYIHLARFSGLGLQEAFTAARPAAELALRLNPGLPEVQNAMGWVQRTADWDFRRAVVSFRRAYELAPHSAAIVADYSVMLNNLGQLDEAIVLARRAVELDPLNATTLASLALSLGWSGRYAEAEQVQRRAVELAPGALEWQAYLSRFQLLQGRLAEAATSAEKEPGERYRLFARAMVLAQQDRPAADALVQDLIGKYGHREASYVAEYYAMVGDADRAFEWLEKARAHRETFLVWSLVQPTLKSLHPDPRWPEFVRKIGLVPSDAK